MHVRGSVSLINILTKLLFPTASYHQPKTQEQIGTRKWLFILSFILITSLGRIIREKEERANRKTGGEVGFIILLPVYLGGRRGLTREGSSIEDLWYLQIYHVNYLGYRAS